MNLGLTTSFIIGGLLMIMILVLNIRMGQHSSELTLHGMSQVSMESVYEVLENDFKKIGYDSLAIPDPIIRADSNIIEFRSNLYDEAMGTWRTITWELTDEEPENTKNPGHRILLRDVDGDETEITLGVTRFRLNYYTQTGLAPMSFPISGSALGDIARIEVIIETQPREGLPRRGGGTYFPTSTWRKVIVPGNINLN
ncbi:MAG: hypothetical protein ACFCU6_11025 [Balneolaceae bacterium]